MIYEDLVGVFEFWFWLWRVRIEIKSAWEEKRGLYIYIKYDMENDSNEENIMKSNLYEG